MPMSEEGHETDEQNDLPEAGGRKESYDAVEGGTVCSILRNIPDSFLM